MSIPITASMLYNLVQCPHRLELDLYEDPAQKDPESKFVQLLWEQGNKFEKEIIEGFRVPFTDLSDYSDTEKEHLTTEVISRGDELIYSGRIRAGDLLGEPDLLKKQGDGYIAGDIKSGAAKEGVTDSSDGKCKKHYAVQIALYTDILEKKGISAGRAPFILDNTGDEVVYDLTAPRGPRNTESLWDLYEDCLEDAGKVISHSETTRPALSGLCKLCHWHTLCEKHLEELDDLTLIPQLGRSKRDAMLDHIKTVSELADIDLKSVIRGNNTILAGVGSGTLRKYQARARLQIDPDAKPYLKQPIDLPLASMELFFDIETDPMRDVCYLHGFVERRNQDNSTERYIPFLAAAPTPEEEERAFAEAWGYVKSSAPCVIYYYSKYERTW